MATLHEGGSSIGSQSPKEKVTKNLTSLSMTLGIIVLTWVTFVHNETSVAMQK